MPKPPDDRPILELKNLGPRCAEQLNAIGVFTAGDIRRLGIKETFEQMMFALRVKGKGNGGCFNAAYLYALYGALHDLDWRELPERKKAEFKKFTAKLRADNG